jgi:hypothetical protein
VIQGSGFRLSVLINRYVRAEKLLTSEMAVFYTPTVLRIFYFVYILRCGAQESFFTDSIART